LIALISNTHPEFGQPNVRWKHVGNRTHSRRASIVSFFLERPVFIKIHPRCDRAVTQSTDPCGL
jgi:hypothetical protein